jgi:hypothetical protein
LAVPLCVFHPSVLHFSVSSPDCGKRRWKEERRTRTGGRAEKRKGEIRGEGGGMYSLSDIYNNIIIIMGITQCAMDPFL